MASDSSSLNHSMENMPNEHLFQTYEAAQYNVPIPDVTIVLNECKWKVHSQLLTSESPFFKRALEGNFKEAKAKEIVLHDDEPWIIARIIQYLYFKYWDGEPVISDENGEGLSVLSAKGPLSRIMHPNKVKDEFEDELAEFRLNKDVSNDPERYFMCVLVKMINTADKYMMDGLINTIPNSTSWQSCLLIQDDSWVVEQLLKGVSPELISKYGIFKDALATFVSADSILVKQPVVQEWCVQDFSFGLLVIKKCVADRDEWKEKARDLQSKMPKRRRRNG